LSLLASLVGEIRLGCFCQCLINVGKGKRK
jgi:hypothetical protein